MHVGVAADRNGWNDDPEDEAGGSSDFWSRDTAMAIGQCTRYLEQLQQVRLRDHLEIVAHHPRATLVIRRSAAWADEQVRALVSLNARLNGVTVITFDLLLAQAERLLEIVVESGT